MNFTQEVIIAAKAPAAADRLVVTAMYVKLAPSGLISVVLPALKPNQPSQRMNTPKAAIGMLCPGIGIVFPFRYFPIRGPRTIAPAKAHQPPIECTTVDPAKS